MLLQRLRLGLDGGGVVAACLGEAHPSGPSPPVLCVGVELDGVETLLLIRYRERESETEGEGQRAREREREKEGETRLFPKKTAAVERRCTCLFIEISSREGRRRGQQRQSERAVPRDNTITRKQDNKMTIPIPTTTTRQGKTPQATTTARRPCLTMTR